jgi:hypothetical protein
LNAVNQDSLDESAADNFATLKRHFTEMLSAYHWNGDWKEKFSQVENDVAVVLTDVDDSATRRQLEAFRVELEMFFASTTIGLGG